MSSVSIIIPTYNGTKRITNLLESLKNQTYSDFEAIVVIDGSTDETYQTLKKFCIENPELKVSVHSNQNSGRSVARNTGAKLSQSKLVIFLDDDVRITDKSFIQRHLAHHKQFPSSILGGMPLEDKNRMKSDIQRYRRYLSLKWITPFSTYYPNPMPKDLIFLSAANFSVSKEVFEKLKGFDDQLKDGEDQDLALRANENNIPVFFDKDLIAWHDDFITCKKYIKRQKEYNRAKGDSNFICKTLPLFKHVIFFIFSFRFWVNIIDSVNVFVVLPKFLRYKIYDLVITSQSKYFPSKHSSN